MPPDHPYQENLEIARRYAALPADKRARFKARLREHHIDGSILPIVALTERPKQLPLSHAQKRLWFMWRLDPTSSAYHISRALRIDGPLNIPALDTALSRLIERHEILRTGFGETDGIPFQHVRQADHGPRACHRHLCDTSFWNAEADPAACLHAQLSHTAALPFDLKHDPLLRFEVLRIAEHSHVVQIVLHHIISDAWSMGMLIRELTACYAQAQRGETSAPNTGLQYADIALWQHEWTDSQPLTRQLAYWSKQLAGDPPVLSLPADRPRPAVRDGRGSRHAIDLDATITAQLKTLSHRHDATLFMTLLHGFNLLLHRYCGETDIWVGVPVAGRQRPETHAVMGLFVNTLVIRSQISPTLPARQQLDTLRDTVLAAQSHADLPFAQLLDALQTERQLSHAPLFQVMFNIEYAGLDLPAELADLQLTSVDSETGSVRFDLSLNVIETPQGLRAIFNYACDMFDAATIARIAADYRSLLTQLLSTPSLHPGDVQLSGAALGSQPESYYPFVPLVPRITAHADKTPEAPAVYCDDTRLNYGELEQWSNQIARRLQQAGVGPETRVGVCLTRSAALPVSLLAVWKAGGVYVPLDPDYPRDRLRDIVDDAGATVIVIDPVCQQQLGRLFASRTLIDITRIEDAQAGGWNEPVHPRQLAYVLYTSGSTGRPKGVALEHEALSLHLRDFSDAYGISSRDVLLQSSTVNFDVALHELLPALIAGGAVRMRGPQAWTLDTLNTALLDSKVSFARIPTALWQQWQIQAPSALPSLRQITVGGEALPGDALARWQQGPLSHIALDNLYGPTETAIAALRHTTRPADAALAIVPIGRPYPGRGAVILDVYGNRMPQGATGELCITGACLARGYLGRPALTAERFIPDPEGPPGSRLYRSGDLCRMDGAGTALFLGRLDQQVKLRGQRIELGEIEAALRACHGITEAVVVLHAAGGRQQLVAYVVGASSEAVLRHTLEQRLPAFMLPSSFITITALPIMANGKLDRRALPAPAAMEAHWADEIAPRNKREQLLLDIWQQVLGCEITSVTANFFAAGGDSILSLQLLTRARQAGLALTPKQIFEYPTIEKMAQAARAILPGESSSLGTERHDWLPLTPSQSRFFDKHPQGLAHWNQAVLLEVRESLDPDALSAALQRLVARHDALRLRFESAAHDMPATPGHRRWRQRVEPVETAVLLESRKLPSESWKAELIQAGTALHQSLNLQQGPLLRAGYFATETQRRLLIVIHHLAVDGVSWRILLQELQALYADPKAMLAPISTPWSRWVPRQCDYAQQAERLWQLAWWQRMLHGSSACLPLTGDGDRRLSMSRIIGQKLQPEATRQLLQSNSGTRIEERLLAALAQTLGPWSSTPRLLIELEGHGREDLVDDVELSNSVGWFTTEYPLALPYHPEPAQTLRMVCDLMRSVPDRGFSWGALKHLGDPASRAALSKLPAPLLRFNYLGRFDQTLPATGRFGFASERSGAQAGDDDTMDHVLDLSAWLADEQLSIHWRYSPGRLNTAELEGLAERFKSILLELIDIEPPLAAACATEACNRSSPGDVHGQVSSLTGPATQDSASLSEAETKDRAVFALWRQRAQLELTLGNLARVGGPAPDADTQTPGFGPLPPGVVPLNGLEAPFAIFCIHAGHGLVAEYRSLAKALNGKATLFGLQAPGLADPGWHPANFAEVAADYVRRIRTVQPTGQYRLLGWSFGGRIVTSMVEQLERQDQQIVLAGLIDTLPERDADDDVAAEVQALRRWIAKHAKRRLTMAERALFEAASQVILDHDRIADTYRPPQLRTPLMLWWSTESIASGKSRDWAARTGASETVLAEIPAGHTSIMHHPALLESLCERCG